MYCSIVVFSVAVRKVICRSTGIPMYCTTLWVHNACVTHVAESTVYTFMYVQYMDMYSTVALFTFCLIICDHLYYFATQSCYRVSSKGGGAVCSQIKKAQIKLLWLLHSLLVSISCTNIIKLHNYNINTLLQTKRNLMLLCLVQSNLLCIVKNCCLICMQLLYCMFSCVTKISESGRGRERRRQYGKGGNTPSPIPLLPPDQP